MASTEHLERLLKRAVLEPGTRPRFLKKLLASNALVFIHYPAGEAQTVWNSQPFAWIRHDGAYVYALFTSEEALAKAPIPGKTAFNIHVQSLFDANPNRHCVVNPGSTYEIQFSADELAHALAIIARAGGATKLMLGARENAAISNAHPLLISTLITFLTGISQVEQAYFMEVELNELPSRPIQIAILVTEIVHIADTLSRAVEGTYGRDLPAKVRVLLRDTPEYHSVKAAGIAPFYDRNWNSRLLTIEHDGVTQ